MTLTIESWRTDDLDHLAGQDHPGLRGQEPGHQGQVRADQAARVQRRARTPSSRPARPATSSPAGRSTPRSSSTTRASSPTSATCPAWRTSPTSPSRPGRPTTARQPSACRWPRSSTASSTTRTPSTSSASRCRRPRTSSSPRSTRSRPTAPTSRWRWAPRTSGKPRPWATRTSARTTGRARKAALALIKGEQKLTDAPWVEPYAELAKWKAYLGDGFEAQTYSDSQNLFTLGRAAIYPAGSWEIAAVQHAGAVQDGRLPAAGARRPATPATSPTTPTSRSASTPRAPNADAAKTFLSWVASPEFAAIYANALPGFFSLSSTPVKMEDPLAQEFVVLAREVQVDDPLDLPDPVARHAEPRERDLGGIGQRDQRHRDARGGRQEAAGRPRQLVQAGQVAS